MQKSEENKYFVEFNNYIYWFELTKAEAESFGLTQLRTDGTQELIDKLNEYAKRKKEVQRYENRYLS